MDAVEHLEECVWEYPGSYGGYSPDGDYCIYSRHRDSSILENVNYEEIFKYLQELQEKLEEAFVCMGKDPYPDEEDARSWVHDFRAGHWGVGWVEYIIVRKDAPYEILKAAGEVYCAISEYPVFNESAYSDKCYEEINEHWENMGTSERIEYCQEVDVSIFAARRDEIPTEVYDRLSETEGFY